MIVIEIRIEGSSISIAALLGAEKALLVVSAALDKSFGGQVPDDFIAFAEALTEKCLQAIPRDIWNALIPFDQEIMRHALALELIEATNTFRTVSDEVNESAAWAS